MGRLDNKVVLVTGAASVNGIGFATARACVREGAAVVLTDLDGEAVVKRATELTQSGARVIGLPQDVRDETAWNAIMTAAVSTFGRLDILVNNAGIASSDPIETTTLEQLESMMATNVSSVYLGCKAAVAQFRRQGGGGAIVNLSSVAGNIGLARCAIYGASKAAVRIFTKSLAAELGPENIRLNSVHPGAINTDLLMQNAVKDPGSTVDIPIPLGRIGEPDDVAEMIVFLSSSEAKYITGAEFVVDGGLSAI